MTGQIENPALVAAQQAQMKIDEALDAGRRSVTITSHVAMTNFMSSLTRRPISAIGK